MQAPPKKLHKSPEIALATVVGTDTQSQMRVLFSGRHDARLGQHTAPHQHSSWEMVYYINGCPVSFWPGTERAGTPGVAWLTPPHTLHGERAETAFSCYYVGLELPADIGWPHWVEDDRHQSIANVIRGIIQEHHRPAEDCKGESDVNERENEMLILLLQQLGLLLRRAQREHVVSPRERLVTRAEQWLSEKCAEPLRLADLARSLGTCPASLRSAFAAERGRSARAFLQETRLQKALSIIKSSSIKLEAIAEMAGYDSASHLTRVIKKATGQTPGALRQLSDKVVRQ